MRIVVLGAASRARRRRRQAAALALALLAPGCLVHERPVGTGPQANAVPLFQGLGSHGRRATTTSAEAQRYFDQGLSFVFAFNHDEAIRSFRKATELDPSCAMAWWGIALAHGPHINNPVVPPGRERAARSAIQRARALDMGGTEVERALIAAQAARYADPPPENRKALDQAYAQAMRRVWQRFPNDADVGALFAEAMMDLRPWDLWTPDGKPQPGTVEITTTLESVIAKSPDHPLALHLYIHATEMSPRPERADAAADRLRDLQPGLGHMVHMPSHIDVRRGRWQEAIVANEKAMEADRRYRIIQPRQGFYGLYVAHNHHMLSYAAMMTGQSALAIGAMDDLIATMPAGWAQEFSAIADGYMVMPLEVRMRFGRWDEILAAPEYPEHFPIARTLRHYARGVAFAAKGQTAEARAEHAAFVQARAQVPAEAFFGNNGAADLLAVAEPLLQGEILSREGKVDGGLAALRKAAKQEDRLRYDEPPGWIQPVRHALGATLLEDGRYVEAERVYRQDLKKLPGNGWALFGLGRSLRLQGRNAEAAAVEAQFAVAWAKADVQLQSSCFCQPGR